MEYPGDCCSHSGVCTSECSRQLSSLPWCHFEQGRGFDPKIGVPHGNLADFNFPTSFQFIGPDRDLVQIDLVQKCLEVADIILGTGLPNYKMAHIPIKSGLHLRAWEEQLLDYPDQRLLQYLTFGFPLSINKSQKLNNQNITNHFSACQFPDAVIDYLHKEIKECAIVGPVSDVNHPTFHCSPLLTKPKDGSKRRVIMDLLWLLWSYLLWAYYGYYGPTLKVML